MDPHPAEVVPQATLHRGARRGVERPARRSERLVDDAGRLLIAESRFCPALPLQPLLAADLTFTVQSGRAATGAGTLHQSGLVRPGWTVWGEAGPSSTTHRRP